MNQALNSIISSTLWLSFLFTFMVSCKSTEILSHAMVVNGSPITKDHPAYSTIVFSPVLTSRGFIDCTSVSIAPGLLVTAAHCIDEAKKIYLDPEVFSMTRQLQDMVEATSFTKHPLFRRKFPAADIALIRYNGDGIKRRSLPIVRDLSQLEGVTEWTMAGFGLDENRESGKPRQAKVDSVRVWVNGVARDRLQVDMAGNSASCFGDSGGPLFAKINGSWHLAGISSGFLSGLARDSREELARYQELQPEEKCLKNSNSTYVFVGFYRAFLLDEDAYPEVAKPSRLIEACETNFFSQSTWRTLHAMLLSTGQDTCESAVAHLKDGGNLNLSSLESEITHWETFGLAKNTKQIQLRNYNTFDFKKLNDHLPQLEKVVVEYKDPWAPPEVIRNSIIDQVRSKLPNRIEVQAIEYP